MPKNTPPKGGRSSRNFDPRYAKKKGPSFHDRHHGRDERSDAAEQRPARDTRPARDSRPGSKSPKHRGHRPAEAAQDAPKRRWTAQERAGRDEARGIRNRAESGRREAPHHRDDRPRDDRPRYNDRDERRSYDRADRPGRVDDRRGPSRYSDDRPRYNGDRGDDRSRGGSPRFDSRASAGSRGDRKGAGRSYGDDRPRRDDDRRTSGRDDRARRDDRPRRDDDRRASGRDDRRSSDRSVRPRYDNDRPRRDDRTARPSRADWNATPAAAPTEDVVHERLKAKAVVASDVQDTTFGDLGLGSNIVETLANLGAASPFAIQAATIPSVLEGRDVLGRGRTGSGKTIAFGAPLVESVLQSQKGKRRPSTGSGTAGGLRRQIGRAPRAIILAPTRELALQIDRTVQPIARSVGLFTTQIYGGVPQGRQVGALKKGVDIVIGTPGRIEDLIEQGKLDLSEVQIAVLDEADHMCELGFVEPVQRILRETADGSQKLLFSATLDREVAALVEEFLVDPAVFEVAGEDQHSSTIDHRVLVIDHRDKAEILGSLVDRDGKTLVFSRTRAYAEMLAEQFEDAGIPAVSLHGDLNQAKRTRNLQKLTSGRVNVLVATDVAARGIHVDDIDLVVQADAPDEYKTYLHRAGRTGRAGREGRVVTLITRQRRRRMTELLDRAEIDAPFEEARPGDDLIEEISGRQLSDVTG
ncbi:DEAD/DEAH box helicase [Microbacterium sp. NIBRBAC000506063]|uniref:DEAD/DEAH box helicase n=1 Tax=Microbacterium sp. NIBRBAC000506063 TaxID=2734618 RepID=UPI001BB6BD07|nr:DEAD/DEAH box helicase [Microbacterium sp. NIBRBAC000506063]QTV80250.1 DEAD/DEAH box helicase [Microbacterium sp. NIBRBAC000506063]